MHASRASASNSSAPNEGVEEGILVCGVNWLGDSVMSMPALQLFRAAHPSASITLLVKPAMAGLWEIHEAPDRILTIEEGGWGTLRTGWALRKERLSSATILPRSFRSALIPFLAGIGRRVGMPGHGRNFLLTEAVKPRGGAGRAHQAYEYLDLLLPGRTDLALPPPRLHPRDRDAAAARARLAGVGSPAVALLPGAARGPSKRWPASRFAEVGKRLAGERRCGIVVLGSAGETPLCAEVAAGIGAGALNLAGQTPLPELAALLSLCALAICNDSGGMHLAAAAGVPVLAVFGVTDPEKTGPLGPANRVLQQSRIRSREVARRSDEARKCLEAIASEQVYEAAETMLERLAKS